jgi:WS/DGAT/MGAT family acyltransferase
MSVRDAGFLYLERSHTQLHIGCLAILEGALSRPELVARIEERLPRLRRYGQRAMRVPLSLGHPSWENDPDFRVEDHVVRWGLPAPGGEGELREAVARLFASPLDRERPLWEMHLLEGLAGGRSALFQKVHHCMIDGVAGAQLLDVLLDETPVARERFGLLEAPRPLPGGGERVRRALGDGLRRQLSGALGVARALSSPLEARRASERLSAAAWSALRLAASDVPRLPWNEPVSHRRQLHFTALPMDGVQLVRRRRSGTVNDVVLSVLAGGLHRYLRALGIETRGLEAVALVPVSLRTSQEAGAMGNRISAMLVPLAVDPEGELARLAATRAITERLKSGAAWTGIDSLLRALDGLPAPLVALAGSRLSLGRVANLVATNVPGPRAARWLCGRRVEALRPIVPIADGLGLGAAVLSYDGTLSVGLNADPSLLPDLEKLGHGIEEAFTALTSAG